MSLKSNSNYHNATTLKISESREGKASGWTYYVVDLTIEDKDGNKSTIQIFSDNPLNIIASVNINAPKSKQPDVQAIIDGLCASC
jgi:hypothetical protein